MRLLDRATELDQRVLGRWWGRPGRRDRAMRLFWVGPVLAVAVAALAVWCARTGRESGAVSFAVVAVVAALFQGFMGGYFYALRCARDGRRPLWDQP